MGYTHYWKIQDTFTETEWAGIREKAKAIIDFARGSGIVIGGAFGVIKITGEYAVTNEINFNGFGDDAHETFVVTRVCMDPSTFHCVKTQAKPYDAVVVAILIMLSNDYPEKIEVSSDGRKDEWKAGLALLDDALLANGKYQIPSSIEG